MNRPCRQMGALAGRPGFTLVELMLAMLFISLLLLAVAMTTIHISNVYAKGVTLRGVNQAGREIADSLRRDIVDTASFQLIVADGTTPGTYVVQKRAGDAYGGRLCTGKVSYVWNYGPYLEVQGVNEYADGNRDMPLRLARVVDGGGELCRSPSTPVQRQDATELLAGRDSIDLALHHMAIRQVAADPQSHQAIYTVDFVVGTSQTNTIDAGQCRPPDNNDNWAYCAVNAFTVTMRTEGR